MLIEPEARRLTTAIAESPDCKLPASWLLESSMLILSRENEDGLRDLDLFLARSRMEVVPFTESQAALARDAFRRFGKGRHPGAA